MRAQDPKVAYLSLIGPFEDHNMQVIYQNWNL